MRPPLGTLVRAPAFWDERTLLSDAALPLAYALLPHNHRLHQKAIRAAWVSHSTLTCVVAVLLLQHLVLCERRHSPLLEGAYDHECTNL